MEKSPDFKNLQSLAKSLAGKQLITNDEFQSGLTDIINAFAQYRSASQEVNKETRDTLNLIVKQVNAEHDRILQEVDSSTKQTSQNVTKELKLALDKVNSLYLDILSTRPKDGEPGQDADEDKIVEMVLAKLPTPKELEPETGETIVDKINALNTEPENQIDWIHIKNVPKQLFNKVVGGGVRLLSNLLDVSITNPTDGQVLTYDSTTGRWGNEDSTGGGGSGGGILFETPTGAVNGANVTFTVLNTPVYIVSDGVQYFEGAGYSLAGLTVTMDYAPTGFIRSAYTSSTPSELTYEVPSGLINGVNVTYTVSTTKTGTLFYQGQAQRPTLDYTKSGTTITFVVAPDTGTDLMFYS